MSLHKSMSEESLSEEKKALALKALGWHGDLFHQSCLSELSKANGLKVIGRELPIEVYGQKTRIDILALTPIFPFKHCVIECKRAHPDFKAWLFLKEKKEGPFDSSTNEFARNENGITIEEGSHALVDHIIKEKNASDINLTLYRRIYIPKIFETNKVIQAPICWNGIEVKFEQEKDRELKLKDIKKLTNKDRIEEACNKVLVGSRGLALQFLSNSEFRNNPNIKITDFLPIILTTAKLYMIDADSEQIDLSEGIIIKEREKDVSIAEHPWLIYNYKPHFMVNDGADVPIVTNAGYYHLHESGSFPKNSVLSVFIVNSDCLSEFLKQFF